MRLRPLRGTTALDIDTHPRVLVVDDDPTVRLFLQAVLEASGCEVLGHAVNGDEALQLVDDLSPGVVVMDLEMPRMGGIEATSWIKWMHPDVEVIIFTGHDCPDDAARAGASKAFRKDQLSELIEAVVASA